MERLQDVVVTGMGVLSPIGIGGDAVWASLLEGRSGVKRLGWFEGSDLPAPLGAEVIGFEPARFVKPRKALKVMSRDIQLAVAAADLAINDAGIAAGSIVPERYGVVFGADMIAADLDELLPACHACIREGQFDSSRWGKQVMSDLFPLWMLKYLPNMPACHVGIIHDARGPNNTLTLAEVSGLAAVAEAVAVIRRGHAEVMIAGATSSRLHPNVVLRNACRQLSRRCDDPAGACRPFDADRDGMVYGEGAAVFVLETPEHAALRGAKILARVRGCASTFEPCASGAPLRGDALRGAIRSALRQSGLMPEQIGHVNAHAPGTTIDDRLEAVAIRETLGDVPVTAPKSYFGNLGAAAGCVEMAVSVLALQHASIPPTLNYTRPDPQCPVNVVAAQGTPMSQSTALLLNHTETGRAVALVLDAA